MGKQDESITTVADDVQGNDLPLEGQQPDTEPTGETGQTTTTQDQDRQQATQPDGQTSPAWWKPDLFQLKYRGTTVSPRDYKHAVSLMQKGWSYESAMAEVKREKEQFEKEVETNKRRWEQYERLEDAFRQNPAFAQRIQQLHAESMAAAQQGAGQQQPQYQQQGYPQDPRVSQLLQQMQGLSQWREQAEAQQADTEIAHEIEAVRAQFPMVQWDVASESGNSLLYDVIVHARDGRFPSIMAAARDYLFDTIQANAKMQGAEQVAQARQRQVRQGVVGTGAPKPAAAPSPVDIRNMDYDQITSLAKQEHGIRTG